MIVKYSKGFDKKFCELSRSDKDLVVDMITFFKESPLHPSLRNHPLTGSMSGKRSISVTDDLRIIFVEKGGYIQVLMLDVGEHDEVYFD